MVTDNLGTNDAAMKTLYECIDGYGNSGDYFNADMWKQIVARWKELKAACPELQPIFLAESCAFGTTGFPPGNPRCQRGRYFWRCANNSPGRDPVELPCKSDVSDDMISYWQDRVGAAGSARLKAQYADLVWEYSEGRKIKDAHKYANCAANEYLNAYAKEPQIGRRCAARAIHLALTMNDQNAVSRAAKLILDRLNAPQATPEPAGAAFDLLIGRDGIKLSSDQEALIIQRLDEALCASQDPSSNPQLCIGEVTTCLQVADRLISYFSKAQDRQTINDVLEKLVKHHLTDFTGAGILASQLLIKLRKKILEHTADKALLQKVDNALRDAGAQSMQAMTVIRTPIAISTAQVDADVARLCQGTLWQAFHGFAMAFTPNPADFRGTGAFDLMRKVCSIAVVDARGRHIGDPTTTTDSEMFHLMCCAIQGNTQLFVYVLGRIPIHFQASAAKVAQELLSCEFFEDSRRDVLTKGIEYAMATEHLNAAHILIPQIEHALRAFVEKCQGSTYQATQRAGATPLKLLPALLDESSVRTKFGERYITYIKMVLTEEMGMNLRNRLCHGMMESNEFSSSTSAILLHVLIILSTGSADDFKPLGGAAL